MDYPENISNPQKLYSSIFEFKGDGNSWLTPTVIKTKYALEDGTLLNILDIEDNENYLKLLKKNNISAKDARILLKIRGIDFFIQQFLKYKKDIKNY